MKNIVIIATGGTIAGSGEAGRTTEYRAGTVAVADILKSVPQLGKLANIEMISLMSVDSNEMDEQKWLQLREVINQQAARDDVDGIVVTHGTDTIEETAYFLNLTVNTAKPVVLTGAMRPATATSADGPFNIYQAVALAADDQAYDCGVVIVRSSRVSNSIVFDEPIFDPHDHFIGVNTLTSYKARILLMLCLTQTNNIAEIRQTFFKY
ncbi:asparaginase domain-containing protein [Limosilactobacillus mucosae]|uniref:asparaginase domain-containing protein n=1 Tax=Limosilactobacillus mucosae TaxID=97478 RepID=UPI000891674E|nr:asparaginase domain-containing protein [Limosilactobacillus mucosae]SDN16232.1 L-asparaginase [Limosilactobacillus mucosae]SEK55209.1 L-asparaginase [Limosilactobacillus mucosae]SFJ98876.1 L-asparaginase [Limosilactobacillus mucosae]